MVRRVVSWALAVVLLVPLLLAIVPSPVSAEEALLYRDLERSRCQEQGLPMPEKHHGCDACVLVSLQGLPRLVATPDLFAELASPDQAAEVAFAFVQISRAQLASIVGPDPGRGPPV